MNRCPECGSSNIWEGFWVCGCHSCGYTKSASKLNDRLPYEGIRRVMDDFDGYDEENSITSYKTLEQHGTID